MTLLEAEKKFADMSEEARLGLQKNIVAGLPGANDNWSVQDVRELLNTYKSIDAGTLRQNLIDFLSEVCPTAEELGMRLCCHPDASCAGEPTQS